MKCPHCDKELQLPWNTMRNIESYGNTQLTVTECCGYGVRAIPVVTYRAEPVTFDTPHNDNWGRPIKLHPSKTKPEAKEKV